MRTPSPLVMGGSAYMCSDQSPWAVSADLAYGFAAVSIPGGSESSWCCACYELTFTSTSIAGKKMIVQATNTGADLAEGQFDLAIPGGGVGIFNACTAEWNAPSSGWGAQYGGISSNTCSAFPSALQPGCNFRFGDFFEGADNPTVDYKQVTCPKALTDKTGCIRAGETPTGSGASSSAAAPASSSTSVASSSVSSAAAVASSASSSVVAPVASSSTSAAAVASSASSSIAAPVASSSSSSAAASIVPVSSSAAAPPAYSAPATAVSSSASSSVAAPVSSSASSSALASSSLPVPVSYGSASSRSSSSAAGAAAPSGTTPAGGDDANCNVQYTYVYDL
ncbi:hypothetical protein LTR78_006031 [Recurvomyces mirabilis]|uniref:cellulase n=1 Tax=Recurvomyces mirabilis TaxID=574656 RepID=A0AAE1C0Y1_9PEZI|nr:hypothetical protein LTR78_006031 [Recurvomyces mirabilis]KAK5155158.1 hypothetical protein LTS14_006113 [Recurvomyces mirabilis]